MKIFSENAKNKENLSKEYQIKKGNKAKDSKKTRSKIKENLNKFHSLGIENLTQPHLDFVKLAKHSISQCRCV